MQSWNGIDVTGMRWLQEELMSINDGAALLSLVAMQRVNPEH